ncbi:DUF7285 family protein [Halomicrobium katesii]|uniref:DUF7285 family protein n=1 Tax=Halomicrobium katesii TaxID=437163 RepID=UPI000478032D|nr:hypothetical protein [Halomicrobium katesii]
MSRSSARGQVEPLVALVAVAAVSLALSLYAGVLGDALPSQRDRELPETTLAAVDDHLAPAGVVEPRRVSDAVDAGPSGYHTNVSVTADGRQWQAGPVAPDDAGTASERVSVRTRPAHVDAGRLRVAVWR